MLKFAHKVMAVKGGNRVVTVTEVLGKGLAKITLIPTEHSKAVHLKFKQLVELTKAAHEKALIEEVSKLKQSS